MSSEDQPRALRDYPDVLDVNWMIWRLYPYLHVATTVEEVERKVHDGSVFTWLHDRFEVGRPRHEPLFLDYLRRSWDVADFGIEANGLVLLQAHMMNAFQQSVTLQV